MGSDKEKKGSKGHELTPHKYLAEVKQTAKAFITGNNLFELLGLGSEPDPKKRMLYSRLLRGTVMQELLMVEARSKHPIAAVGPALAIQLDKNDDLSHNRKGNASVLCDISYAVSDLFRLMKRDGVSIGKNAPTLDAKLIETWRRSSVLDPL